MRAYVLIIFALITAIIRGQTPADQFSSPNLILNGGFELPGLPSGTNMLFLSDGSTYISGWTVINDTSGQPPFYGNTQLNDAVLNGGYGLVLNQESGVRTTFRTEPGAFYEFSLWLRPDDCQGCQTPAALRVTISGQAYFIPIVSGWSYQTIQFYSTNTIHTLELFNPASTPDFKRWTIDDVAVRKVPGATLGARLQPVVTIEGPIGAKFQIQSATQLNAPNWMVHTNLTLSNSPTFFLDTNFHTGPFHRIYRAIRLPN